MVYTEVKPLTAYCLFAIERNVKKMFAPDSKGGGLKHDVASTSFILVPRRSVEPNPSLVHYIRAYRSATRTHTFSTVGSPLGQ